MDYFLTHSYFNTLLLLAILGLAIHISLRLKTITRKETFIMADLDAVLADVADEKTQIAGLSTLTAGLKQQLADALAGTTLPPAVQAKVDAVFAGVEANKQAVVDAINANTPAAPPPA